jgi:hypothetical protein
VAECQKRVVLDLAAQNVVVVYSDGTTVNGRNVLLITVSGYNITGTEVQFFNVVLKLNEQYDKSAKGEVRGRGRERLQDGRRSGRYGYPRSRMHARPRTPHRAPDL